MARTAIVEPLHFYKWHYRDYRANRKVQRMSWQAKGLYRELLDEYWQEGSLPVDHGELADICGCTQEEFAGLWPQMAACWSIEDGLLVNQKMDSQRTLQDQDRANAAVIGRKGGLAKAANAKKKLADASGSVADASALPSGSSELLARREEKRREEERREEERKRRSPETEMQDASKTVEKQSGKDLVVIGKSLEKPKSILVSETNDDLEKSAPECSLSTIPTSLPETNGMEDPSVAQNSPTPEAVEQGWAMLALLATEDENQGATPPPQPQQARVEALVGAKPTSNQPAAVTFDEWPESVDWVEAIKNLIRAHPRPTIGCATTTAAIEQVDNVQQFRGGTKWDAYTYLLERVMLYKAATDKWPEDRKSRITGVLKFLQGEEYQQDEAIWNYSSRDGRDNKGTGNIPSVEEALREDGEAGSTGDSPKRIIPFVRAEDIKRKQQAARAGAYGRRSGTAYPRTF